MSLFNDTGAEFSPCKKYRYKLWRIWDASKPKAMCIGLNPSTANEAKNDATITHLSIMLKKLGYGGFYMVNLFAWISSKPEDLLTVPDPYGSNDIKLLELRKEVDEVIFCWGAFKEAQKRAKVVSGMFKSAKCFGYNQDGSPFHPLAMMYKGLTNEPKLINFLEPKAKSQKPKA